MTTDITASPFAGVGNPLNVVDCVESRLNIASLRAAHTGIIDGNIIISVVFTLLEFTNVGAYKERESLSR
jgi:hypothetical protein